MAGNNSGSKPAMHQPPVSGQENKLFVVHQRDIRFFEKCNFLTMEKILNLSRT